MATGLLVPELQATVGAGPVEKDFVNMGKAEIGRLAQTGNIDAVNALFIQATATRDAIANGGLTDLNAARLNFSLALRGVTDRMNAGGVVDAQWGGVTAADKANLGTLDNKVDGMDTYDKNAAKKAARAKIANEQAGAFRGQTQARAQYIAGLNPFHGDNPDYVAQLDEAIQREVQTEVARIARAIEAGTTTLANEKSNLTANFHNPDIQVAVGAFISQKEKEIEDKDYAALEADYKAGKKTMADVNNAITAAAGNTAYQDRLKELVATETSAEQFKTKIEATPLTAAGDLDYTTFVTNVTASDEFTKLPAIVQKLYTEKLNGWKDRMGIASKIDESQEKTINKQTEKLKFQRTRAEVISLAKMLTIVLGSGAAVALIGGIGGAALLGIAGGTLGASIGITGAASALGLAGVTGGAVVGGIAGAGVGLAGGTIYERWFDEQRLDSDIKIAELQEAIDKKGLNTQGIHDRRVNRNLVSLADITKIAAEIYQTSSGKVDAVATYLKKMGIGDVSKMIDSFGQMPTQFSYQAT